MLLTSTTLVSQNAFHLLICRLQNMMGTELWLPPELLAASCRECAPTSSSRTVNFIIANFQKSIKSQRNIKVNAIEAKEDLHATQLQSNHFSWNLKPFCHPV